MKKAIPIDLTSDRLIAIAADMVDEHNYIDALKMLNKNAELWGNDSDSFMLYAEIFDDMELNEKCINGWFRFLDCPDVWRDEDLTDCFEGLAVAYMNMGMEQFGAYYYGKMLDVGKDYDPESRAEILQSLLSGEPSPLKVAYPPSEADYSDVISRGIDFMKSGELDNAVNCFAEVERGNPRYPSARNYIAMCHVMAGNHDAAEEECLNLLSEFPDDVNSLTTLAAVKIERAGAAEEAEEGEQIAAAVNLRAESRALAEKLLSIECDDADDLYRIATVCCENKMHAEAYKIFSKVAKDRPFDTSLLFFTAVSAYNCGKFTESFAFFDRLLTINPYAVTAQYLYDRAREWSEEQPAKEMSYFYLLPRDLREKNLHLLAALMKLSRPQARKLCETLDVRPVLDWCFEEDSPSRSELQTLGAEIAEKLGCDDFVQSILLNAFCEDEIKIRLLTSLCARNEGGDYGVVLCHVYKRIYLEKLSLGRAKRKIFINAYSGLVGHFAFLDEKLVKKFARATEKLYLRLSVEERLDGADNPSLVTAAIFMLSGAQKSVQIEDIAQFFSIEEEKLKTFLGE